MKTIMPLPEGVRHSMRSGIIMFDMSRVVEELVFNSLDAGATKVSIFVGVITSSVKVVDDGSGVSRDDLVLLGERYATSKFQDFTNIESASESFGFRGEALASISDISMLEITTKAIGRPNGYRKVMKGSKCIHLGIDDDRKDSGTTVTVRDLFYNQPVRQKYMQSSPKKVLDSITKCVFRIALVHSNVSFSVFDVESDEELFQTNPSSSAFSLLMRDTGVKASNSLCKVNVTDGDLNVSGYISGPGDGFKDLQYIYINSRFVSKGPIHKMLSNMAASFESKDEWKPDELQTGRRNRIQSNPGYFLCITCPRHLYEFSFEPSKTNVEFKNWEPVLTFIERIILDNWKKDTCLVFDEGADLLAKGDRQDLIDDMSKLENDWPEVMEPIKKKLKKSNEHAPSSFLFSPSADLKRDGDYFFQEKDAWSPQYDFELKIQNLKEQDRQTDSLQQSCDIKLQQSEDFPQVIDLLETSLVAGVKSTKQFLTRCQSSTPLNINHDFMKESDELDFQFEGFKSNLDVSNGNRKHLLRGCSSRGSQSLHEPILSHGEGSERVIPMIFDDKQSNSLIRVLETKESGSYRDGFSDTYKAQEITRTPNCSLGSLWQDTDWFTPQRYSNRGSIGIGEDFHLTPTDISDFFSYEDKFVNKRYFSSVNVENSGAGTFCLSSEWSPVFATPLAAKWKSDYQKGCRIFEGSLCLEKSPDPEDFFSAANDIKFDHEAIPQMNCREACTDSFADIQNCTVSGEKHSTALWGHADNVAHEDYNIRKDKSSHRDDAQKYVGKRRSRRSQSAPPFHQEKKRFISLSCRPDTKLKKSDPSELDDLECLTQPCNASHKHPKASIIDDVPCDTQETEERLSSASDLKASAGIRAMHLETQGEDADDDSNSEENLDPVVPTTKWRHNCSVSQAANEPHEPHDQDNVLDICSGFLHLRSNESLVPESINRQSLEDAKVLQQVDKKYIPIVACGTVAIVDQHAADERIRLEELRKKVLTGESRTVTYLSADQELVLPEMGYQLLQSYAEQIREWGWICNINEAGSTSFKKNMSIIHKKPTPVTLNAVPCILGVNLSEVDLLEFLQQLAETDGSSTIPPSVLRVLNSKACRGAIMFGDSLLPSECSLIIEGLKQTSLCFQCAHGRPTTVPLVNLKALHKQIAKLGSRQPWNGFQRREISLDRAKSRLDEAKS